MLLRRVSFLLLTLALGSLAPIPDAREGIPLPGPEHAYAQTEICEKHQICISVNLIIADLQYCYEKTLCYQVEDKPAQPARLPADTRPTTRA